MWSILEVVPYRTAGIALAGMHFSCILTLPRSQRVVFKLLYPRLLFFFFCFFVSLVVFLVLLLCTSDAFACGLVSGPVSAWHVPMFLSLHLSCALDLPCHHILHRFPSPAIDVERIPALVIVWAVPFFLAIIPLF